MIQYLQENLEWDYNSWYKLFQSIASMLFLCKEDLLKVEEDFIEDCFNKDGLLLANFGNWAWLDI